MVDAADFHAEMKALLRERALDAAADIVTARGWAAVHMSTIAQQVGISRPLLYKELGTKEELARALITRETERFIEGVVANYRAHPDDVYHGLFGAIEHFLVVGSANPLIKAIIGGRGGGAAEILPVLLTESENIIDAAVGRFAAALREIYPELAAKAAPQMDTVIETVVRLSLSHLIQPAGTVQEAVEQVRWASRVLLGEVLASGAADPPQPMIAAGSPTQLTLRPAQH